MVARGRGRETRLFIPYSLPLLILTLLLHPLLLHSFHPVFQIGKKEIQHGHLPMVFILGVQKGGSSSLYEFLIEHPLLCGGLHKEPHFFDFSEAWAKGVNYYKALYTDKKCAKNPDARYVDGTTMMHRMELIAPRIASVYNGTAMRQLKFIVLFREPVARDLSWYQHMTRDFLSEGVKFADIKTMKEYDTARDQKHKGKFKRAGNYVQQLEAFANSGFKRDQILIFNSGDLFRNSSKVMDAISGFLGIKKLKLWNGEFPHDDHLGKYADGEVDCIGSHVPPLDCDYKEAMAAYYETWNAKLYTYMKNSHRLAPSQEPEFPSFQEEWKNVSCVMDAKAEMAKIIEAEKAKQRESCSGSGVAGAGASSSSSSSSSSKSNANNSKKDKKSSSKKDAQ